MTMLSRRRLLALATGLIQACALWPERGAAAAPADPGVQALESCLDLFGDCRDAVAVGRRYLQLAPREARSDWLAERILRAVAAAGDGGTTPNGQARFTKRAVSAAIRADFAAERVVSLDGWVLSRLEARVCALVALSQDRQAS